MLRKQVFFLTNLVALLNERELKALDPALIAYSGIEMVILSRNLNFNK